MTLISPCDFTLQCDMWLWNHDSEFTKWQHPAMRHVAIGPWHWIRYVAAPCNVAVALGWHAMEFAQTSAILEFWFLFWTYHRNRHVILHQSEKFYPNRTTLAEKNDVMSIFKMADLSHLGFYGSNNGFFESPCTTSCRSSIETMTLNCLVFEKIAFFAFWRLTD